MPQRPPFHFTLPTASLGLAALLALSGCSSTSERATGPNPFRDVYQDQIAGQSIVNLRPYSGQTQIFNTSDLGNDDQALLVHGFGMIGQSGFEGTAEVTQKMLQAQGHAVGADVVLYATRDDAGKTVPFPIPNFSSSSIPTIIHTLESPPPAEAQELPVAPASLASPSAKVARVATFWRKAISPIFGALPLQIPLEMMIQNRISAGVLFSIVEVDSPAATAGVQSDDILVAIDGTPIENTQQWTGLLKSYAGKTATITLLRGGVEKKLSVQMRVGPGAY